MNEQTLDDSMRNRKHVPTYAGPVVWCVCVTNLSRHSTTQTARRVCMTLIKRRLSVLISLAYSLETVTSEWGVITAPQITVLCSRICV